MTDCDGHLEMLLARARAGDRTALDQLLLAYRNYLHLLARLQITMSVAEPVDPSDLVQETLLEAFRAFGQFVGQSERQWVAWLRRILVRNLADELKAQRRHRRDVQRSQSLEAEMERSADQLDQTLAGSVSTPSARASQKERSVLLADALSRLPADYREVIVLRQLEGRSFDEVSRRMDRTQAAARKLWARALEHLKNELRGIL
jgi:RNA polymerase sigma-70 factor (ECF subfamily)